MTVMTDFLAHESSYRGEKEVAARSKVRIAILGLGALGSWTTDLLVRQGYSALTLIDFDRVEKNNFGTQNYGQRDTGRMKSTISANNIFLRLGVKPEAIEKKIDAQNVDKFLKNSDLVVDLFDNYESRGIVAEYCLKSDIPCLHAGLSSDGFAEISWNESFHIPVYVDKHDPDMCFYPLASNLVLFTVAITAETINKFVDYKIKESIHFTLKDMHTHCVWRKNE